LFVLTAGGTLVKQIHPFLAPTHRVEAEILVVDGPMHLYGLKAVMEEFQRGKYRRLVTTGGACDEGENVEPDDTYAKMNAGILKRLGVSSNVIDAVPARPVRRDRTYASAMAVKAWLASEQPQVTALNLMSVGPHARRSRLLYEEALGERIPIGIIAIEDRDYDPRAWWQYSEGVKQVISETAAYLYARFLFRPAPGEA
jgi:hypothetical protein